MELRKIVPLTARQARFGIWRTGETGWPLVLTESWGEYSLERQAGQPAALVDELPDDADGIAVFDALARAEGTPTWAEQRATIRRECIESEEFDSDAELVEFDDYTRTGPRIP